MTYNPTRFCHSLEGGIQGIAMAMANAAAAERAIDRSGPLAIARLSGALRAERRRSAALETSLAEAIQRAEAAELAVSLLRQRLR